jgi:hypothetical protein
VKDENGDLLADSHNILNRLKSYFSQLLNVHSVRDVRLIEIHTAEPLVHGLSPSEVEIVVVKMKKYKLPGSDQIPAELIETEGETLLGFRNSVILFGIRKNNVVPVYRKINKTDCIHVIIMRCHCFQLHTKLYPISFSQG